MIQTALPEIEKHSPDVAQACSEIVTHDMAFTQLAKGDGRYGEGKDFLLNAEIEPVLVHACVVGESPQSGSSAVFQLLDARERPPTGRILECYASTVGSYQLWAVGRQVSSVLACARFPNGWIDVAQVTTNVLRQHGQHLRAAYILGRDLRGNLLDTLACPQIVLEQLGSLITSEIITPLHNAGAVDPQIDAPTFLEQNHHFYDRIGITAAAAALVVPERFENYL